MAQTTRTLVWIQEAGPPCRASVSPGTRSSTSGCSNGRVHNEKT